MGRIVTREMPDVLARRAVWPHADLIKAGFTRRQVQYLVETGKLRRIAHGIMGTSAADAHPRMRDVVACLVTGGIVCGRTAGARHGLIDDVHPEIEVLVPHGSGHHPATQPVRLIQSRNPASFTVGIEMDTILDVQVRMTDRARTVVDLVRTSHRLHGIAAVHAFLSGGGSVEDLEAMAAQFGVRDRVDLIVAGALQAMSRAGGG